MADEDGRVDSEGALTSMRERVGDGMLTAIVVVYEWMDEKGETYLGLARDTQSPMWKSLGMAESARNDMTDMMREVAD